MARRHGPQLQNLMYDRASAADDLIVVCVKFCKSRLVM